MGVKPLESLFESFRQGIFIPEDIIQLGIDRGADLYQISDGASRMSQILWDSFARKNLNFYKSKYFTYVICSY
jgi:hypothetical protein